VLGKNRFPP